jgi:hypothetical protein
MLILISLLKGLGVDNGSAKQGRRCGLWIQKSKNEQGAFLGGEAAKVTLKNLRERSLKSS